MSEHVGPESPALAGPAAVSGAPVGRFVRCGMMAALMAVLSWVSVPLPISPIPITLQTLGVLLAGGLLGRLWGPVSVCVYLLLGLVGVPVFAGGSSGIGEFAGPRGGYLVGFVLAAFVMGLSVQAARRAGALAAARSSRPRGRWASVAVLAGGGVVAAASIYAVGVPWLSVVMGTGLGDSVVVGMAPFLPGDLLKLAVAVPLIRSVDAALLRAGLR
jgi:biotin transport system substrate-specific component